MSLMAMNRIFKKYGVFLGGLLALIMIMGVVLSGFGTTLPQNTLPPETGSQEVPVATVNGVPVNRMELNTRLDSMLQQQQMFGQRMNPSLAERENFLYLMLNSVKQEQAVILAAKKAGVNVTDEDIRRKREEIWQQGRLVLAKSLGLTDKATDSEIEAAMMKVQPGMTLDQFKRMRVPDNALRIALYNEGLTNVLKKQANITEADVRRSYNEIQVRHILIKSGEGGLPDAQAKAKAEKLLKEIQANPAKMAELAKANSDDPGSKDKGGFYDWAPASQYVPEFTKAALEAGVGKVYPEPVKTQFGYHIIKSEGERPGKDFPKDFDKEKQKYIDQYAESRVASKVQEAVQAEIPNVKVEITDPYLKAAQLQEEASKATDPKAKAAKYDAALTELAKIKKEADANGIVPQLKAGIYSAQDKNKEAIAAFEEALTYTNTVEMRMAIARLYLKEKDKANALKQLTEADKLAVPDFQTQMQMGFLYEEAGDKAKADAARQKANEMMKRMAELQAKQAEEAKAALPSSPAPSPSSSASPAPAQN